jgi:dephospho-CoA kinase
VPSLGITGGIATGKSSLTERLLRSLPGECFDADRCAHELLATDAGVRGAVREQFGARAYAEDGSPNRAYLRGLVFSDSVLRKQLEAILHPVIRDRWMALVSEASAGKDWLFVDIPLLFESGVESCFDHVAVVACSPDTQLRRLTDVRGLTRDIAEKMISAQMDLRTKMSKADHLIWNDSSVSCLDSQAALLAGWFLQSHA